MSHENQIALDSPLYWYIKEPVLGDHVKFIGMLIHKHPYVDPSLRREISLTVHRLNSERRETCLLEVKVANWDGILKYQRFEFHLLTEAWEFAESLARYLDRRPSVYDFAWEENLP